MVNTKLNEGKNAVIVKKVAIAATLRNIPHRTEAHFLRRELCTNEGSLKVAVCRLNKKAGRQEYEVRVDSGDGSFWIRRK